MLRRPNVDLARKLRKTMSPAEGLLWQYLRGSPAGMRFRKQHPIDPYVADFYCARARLVIEVDGQVHDDPQTAERDQQRTDFLEAKGYKIARFSGANVMGYAAAVADSIVALASSPLHHASRGPPPRPGEEQE